MIIHSQKKILASVVEIQTTFNNTFKTISENHFFNNVQILFDHFTQLYAQTQQKIISLQAAVLYAKRDIVHPIILNLSSLTEIQLFIFQLIESFLCLIIMRCLQDTLI